MKIAVTGGIAEGKSTVLTYLSDAGFAVTSADLIAREVFSENYIQRELGELIGVSAPVERDDLKTAIAMDPKLRRKVNSVMHPVILERLQSRVESVIEVPLLFEACIYGAFDRVWVVTCGAEEQLRRLTARLGDEDLARQLIGAQLPTDVKVAFADTVIRTNQDEDAVKRCVMTVAGRSI